MRSMQHVRTLARVAVFPLLAALVIPLHACGIGSSVPRGATSLLQAFEPPSAEEAAEWALDEYNADNRYRGLILLADTEFGGEPIYLQLYRDRLGDEDSGVRQAAARAIGIHGEPSDALRVAALLEDDDRLVRGEAARALQKLHDPAVTELLIARLDRDTEPEPEVRAEAAHALGQYPSTLVVQALIGALADRSLAVNHNAALSLETLTGQNLGTIDTAWLTWLEATDDPFAAGRLYTYPGFSRPRHPVEWIPIFPPPPNTPGGPPVGMPRDAG